MNNNNNNTINLHSYRPIKHRILILTLIVSTVMSTIFTFVTLFIEFSIGSEKLQKSIDEVEYTTVGSLKSSLWNLDTSLIDIQLDDLLRVEGINTIILEDDEKREIFNKTKPKSSDYSIEDFFQANVKNYELYFESEGADKTYGGKLVIIYSNYIIFKEVMTKALIIFTTQASKTFFVTFILLFLYERLITKDLLRTSKALGELDVGALKERSLFPKKREMNDEIAYLQNQVDVMFHNLVEKNKLNKDLLEQANIDKKLQEAKAYNATRLASLGEMAAGIAHEINNPITIIQTSLKSFNRKIEMGHGVTEQESRKHVDRVNRAIDRVVQIINNMKKVSRDGTEDEIKLSNIHDILEDTLVYFKQKFSTEGINFEFDIPQNIQAYANEVELCQVLTNLVNNSSDAIKGNDHKWIKVSVFDDQSCMKILVRDSGAGISNELKKKVFDPFFTTKDIGEGTGLGLSISKEAMNRMGGDLKYCEGEQNTQFAMVLSKNTNACVA